MKTETWLARNIVNYDYVVSTGIKLERLGGAWKAYNKERSRFTHTSLCAEDFEHIIPKSCLLNPGDGPILVDIKITKKNRFTRWLTSLLTRGKND